MSGIGRACRITDQPITCRGRHRPRFELIRFAARVLEPLSLAQPGRASERRTPLTARQTPCPLQGLIGVIRRAPAKLRSGLVRPEFAHVANFAFGRMDRVRFADAEGEQGIHSVVGVQCRVGPAVASNRRSGVAAAVRRFVPRRHNLDVSTATSLVLSESAWNPRDPVFSVGRGLGPLGLRIRRTCAPGCKQADSHEEAADHAHSRLPYHGSAHNLQGSPSSPLRADQVRRQNTTSGLPGEAGMRPRRPLPPRPTPCQVQRLDPLPGPLLDLLHPE